MIAALGALGGLALAVLAGVVSIEIGRRPVQIDEDNLPSSGGNFLQHQGVTLCHDGDPLIHS